MGVRPGESALGTVIADLAEAGYVGSWFRLRAADVGAPHLRERIFILATDAGRIRVDADGGVRGGDAGASGRPALAPLPAGAEGALAADALAHGPAFDGSAEHGSPESLATNAWGPYAAAVERWELVLGRAAPQPTDARGRLNPDFVEWMMGFPEGWTAGEKRTARLRMLGNAVQVQCGEVVGRLLLRVGRESNTERSAV